MVRAPDGDGIALVVFDLAGTLLDHGSRAPVAAFRAVFAAHGVPVTIAQAAAPMGLDKRAHLRAMLGDYGVATEWRRVHGRAPSDADADALYAAFAPLQLDAILGHGRLVPGALAAIARLRARGIRVATTTGYFREAARLALDLARAQGFVSDADVCVADVAAGRPAPDMIARAMAMTGVASPSRVVNVGDTVFDIEAAKRAGVFSVGVLRTSIHVGATEREWDRLKSSERNQRVSIARVMLSAAGPDALVESVADLPDLVLGHDHVRSA